MIIKLKGDFRDLVTDERTHSDLCGGAEYFVLELDDEHYRIVNHRGEPILYPKRFFVVTNCRIPAGWQFREYDDGEYFLSSVETAAPGFYEDWHGSDGDRDAQAVARQVLYDELIRTAKNASPEEQGLISEAVSRLPS